MGGPRRGGSMAFQAAVILILAVSCASGALAQTSTCIVKLTGTTVGGVASAAVSCTGKTVAIRGSAALTPFSAKFSGTWRS